MNNHFSLALIAERKERARRALWRMKHEQVLGVHYTFLGLAMAQMKMQLYANGEVVEETGCLVCLEKTQEEIEELYNHIDLEGFHCESHECLTQFHAMMPQYFNCCSKPYNPDSHPLGDPFPHGDPFPPEFDPNSDA